MRLAWVTVALSVLVVLGERKIGFGDKKEAGFELEEREGNTQRQVSKCWDLIKLHWTRGQRQK